MWLKKRRPREKLPKKAQGLMGEAHIRYARGQKEDALKLCMEVVKLGNTKIP
jgi:general transcription factor 3C polypeptide 3 (transcription factor C subunit 4)